MRFTRDYSTEENRDYWDRLDRAVEKIRAKRESENKTSDSKQSDERPRTSRDGHNKLQGATGS